MEYKYLQPMLMVMILLTLLPVTKSKTARGSSGISEIEDGDYITESGVTITATPLEVLNRNLTTMFPKVSHLSLSDNHQLTRLTEDALSGLQNLKSLALKNCPLNEMPNLQPLATTLESLSIENANIDFITNDTFIGLSALNTLTLKSCPLQAFPMLSGLGKLAKVHFEHTSITEINSAFLPETATSFAWSYNTVVVNSATLTASMPLMTELTLVQNTITEHIEDILQDCTALIKFNADSNNLNQIPSFGNCSWTIQNIWLNSNNISDIPRRLIELTELKYLDLTDNPLISLPDITVDDLPHFTSLIISKRRLPTDHIDDNFNIIIPANEVQAPESTLKVFPLLSDRTTKVSLATNQIEAINASSFTNSSQLENLDLSSNELQSFPPIAILPKLTTLALSGNLIANVTWEQANPTDLEVPSLPLLVLDMSYLPTMSSDTDASLWDRLTALQKLRLIECGLKEVPVYINSVASTLTELYLDKNQINELNPEILSKMTSLEVLKLSSNQLTEIPSALLRRMPKLRQLYLDNNKLQTLTEVRQLSTQNLDLWLKNNEFACDARLCWVLSSNVNMRDNEYCHSPVGMVEITIVNMTLVFDCAAYKTVGEISPPVEIYERASVDIAGSMYKQANPDAVDQTVITQAKSTTLSECSLECTLLEDTCRGIVFQSESNSCYHMVDADF